MGIFDILAPVAGGVGGFLLGGPAGAMAGAKLGSTVASGVAHGKEKKALQARQTAQDELLRRQAVLGEREFQRREPLRKAGSLAALKFLSGPTRGIFQTPRTAGELTGGVTQELQPFGGVEPPAPISTAGDLTNAIRSNPRSLTGLKGIAGLAKRFAQGRKAGGGSGGDMSSLSNIRAKELV